ncbi:MAG: hypothetical protein JWN44_5109, partial [Myxococcales bacterium]|nr:hypothetical protein [Myxococcales bacterium]
MLALGSIGERDAEPPAVNDPTSTVYQYDLDRRLTTLARPGDAAIQMTYDTRGRIKRITHPLRIFTFNYETGTAGANGAAATPSYGRLKSITDN